jgi:hypothetical protein
MFALKPIIFDFFGLRDRTEDKFPDANGKGLHQRFIELMAGDLDDNELSLINLLVENTCNPFTCFERFIPDREGTFGTPIMSPDAYTRRKIIALIKEVNRRKGTKWGYIFLFRMLGFYDAVINEIFPVYGFDSPTTFDDPDRVFDMRCYGCSGYTIDLFGGMVITDAIIQSVNAVIKYNEPINADLVAINYNGVALAVGQGDFSDDFNEDFYI